MMQSFISRWLYRSVTVWFVAGMLTFGAWWLLGAPLVILQGIDGLEMLANLLQFMVFWVLPGAIIGFTLGRKQQNLLEEYLYEHTHHHLRRWQWHSLQGGFLGGICVIGLVFVFNRAAFSPYHVVALMPIFVFWVSFAQWSVLNHIVHDAWLWVLANVIGGVVFSSLLFLNPQLTDATISALIMWLIGALAQGFITGATMEWLLSRRMIDKYAYARVRIKRD